MERLDAENMHRLLAAVLKADSNVIDVGAHGGAFLREAISFAPDGRHIALEPLPHLAARLEEDFPQVDVYCTAASDRVGTASFFHAVDVEPWSGLKSRPLPDGKDPVTEEIEVTLTPIDQLLPEGYRVDLLKIDVEGAEEKVLQTVNPDAFELCLVEREDAEGVGSGRGQRIDARMQQAGLRETSGLHDHWNRIYVHQPAVEVVLNASWMRVAGPGRRAKLDAERWRGRELLRAIAEASCIAKQPVECVTHLSENAVYMSVHSRTEKKTKGSKS
jgi:FkbM family methyltransferase